MFNVIFDNFIIKLDNMYCIGKSNALDLVGMLNLHKYYICGLVNLHQNQRDVAAK
jgi:hypothetical protein